MSRIGKMPITLPAKVEVQVGAGNLIQVKGPKGSLSFKCDPDLSVAISDNNVEITRPTNQKRHRSAHGLTRALLANMVKGVSDGYVRQLELVGVGFRCTNQGQLLELSIGFSHPILFMLPDEIKIECKTEKGSNPTIILSSNDKELLGQVAAKIRSFRKPEPYKGKGIRYTGEYIRRKAGKTASK